MMNYALCVGILLVGSTLSLPKHYTKTLYEPGGLDHLDATGDESKWGKLVRWILTGKSTIPNEMNIFQTKAGTKFQSDGSMKKPTIIHPDGFVKPNVIVHPDGLIKPNVIVHPDGLIKPNTIVHPDGLIKPNTIVHPDGFVKPNVGVHQPNMVEHPDSLLKPSVHIHPDGYVKPIANKHQADSFKDRPIFHPDGLVKPNMVVHPNGNPKTNVFVRSRVFDAPKTMVHPDGYVKQVPNIQQQDMKSDLIIHSEGPNDVVHPDGFVKSTAVMYKDGSIVDESGFLGPSLARLGIQTGPMDYGHQLKHGYSRNAFSSQESVFRFNDKGRMITMNEKDLYGF